MKTIAGREDAVSNTIRKKLEELCSDYIWLVLIGWDQNRFQLHNAIGVLLGVKDVHIGLVYEDAFAVYIQWALNNLEDSVGLPHPLKEKKWKEVSKRYGKKLAEILLQQNNVGM